MDTISDNNKAMYKIIVMAEALEKCDKVYGPHCITSVSHVLKGNEYGGTTGKGE